MGTECDYYGGSPGSWMEVSHRVLHWTESQRDSRPNGLLCPAAWVEKNSAYLWSLRRENHRRLQPVVQLAWTRSVECRISLLMPISPYGGTQVNFDLI